jgi:hypothetical protein
MTSILYHINNINNIIVGQNLVLMKGSTPYILKKGEITSFAWKNQINSAYKSQRFTLTHALIKNVALVAFTRSFTHTDRFFHFLLEDDNVLFHCFWMDGLIN